MSQVNSIIRARKSVYPAQYIDKPISKEIITELLENANHAPTHRMTEPWRFKVFMGESKAGLAEFLANKYKETEYNFVESKYDKIKNKISNTSAMLAIILHRDKQERVPEWEEIASVACAVQNIWLSCHQYGIGGYWSTPGLRKYLNEFVKLEDNETCLGFFYLGHYEENNRILKKNPITEKISWHD